MRLAGSGMMKGGRRRARAFVLGLLVLACPVRATAQEPAALVTARGDSVMVRMVDADLRAALQALGRYLDRPVVLGDAVTGGRITLETPSPVPLAQVPALLRGVLESQNLTLVADSGFYRVASRQAEAPAPTPQVAGQAGPLQLYVIRLSHARAADVAATVNALFGRASAFGELGTGPAPTLSQELRQERFQAMPQPEAQAQAGALVARQSATLTGATTIVPDARTNSLLIRASPTDFELIQAAVQQIDVRPLQVLIEVVIAEVRKDRSLSFGTSATLPPTRVDKKGDTELSGATTGLGVGDFVLHVMDLGGVDLDAVLRVAASRGDATILSRPVLLAANNEVAHILVGTQRPFVQIQRVLPTDAVLDQIIQFKEVGTDLTVRPTISADGYVMLEVTQEVNSATGEVSFDAPVISTRAVQTQLLIRDGHTAVLGGLADNQREKTKAGVPVLSSIPLLGGLFGRQSYRNTESELFLFLTPRVIRSDAELDDASEDVKKGTRYLDRLKELRPDPLRPDTTPPLSPSGATPDAIRPPAPSQPPAIPPDTTAERPGTRR